MEGTGIFHDGMTARGHQCRVHFSGTTIHLYFNEDNSNYLVWDVAAIVSCHLSAEQVTVKYGTFPHQTLDCFGEIGKAIYKTWSARSISARAGGFSFHRNTARTILLALAFILLIVFAWFVVLPWSGEKAANLVPISTEISMGDNLANVFTSDNKADDSLSGLVQRFADRLQLSDQYKIRITVLQSDEINAFALPGGRIFIYSGILKGMDSYEELAALLGHEVSHVTNRHSLRSICRSAAGSIFIASLFGDVTGISSGILAQADEFKQLDYSRKLESDADEEGLRLMIRNRVSGRGMLKLLELLNKEGKQMPALMKYLSTHPETEARIRHISGNPLSGQTFPVSPELEEDFRQISLAL